ncbi:glycerophosphodiester phosphodiesterase [Nocardiopsis alba]|uniref:glycerophosphodiester phosphodiesterase n=1 Tax=Nocardiopsis alba TaxID=53437 RepID=UPI00366BAFF7
MGGPVHQRIGFIVGVTTLSLSVLASPALATTSALAPQERETTTPTTTGSAGPGAQRVGLDSETSSRPIIAVAHRGASGTAPENTLAAIDEADRLGAETVEVDVQLTADDELVIMHDTTLERTTDVAEVFPDRAPYDVGDFTMEEIRRLDAGSSFGSEYAGEPVPDLREVLDRLKEHEMNLLLEIKAPELYPGIEKRIADELARSPYWLMPDSPDEPHRLVVQSFDWESTELSQELLPSVPHGLLGLVPTDRIEEYSWARMINPSYKDVDADYVSAVHEAGLEIMPYTINDPEQMRRTLETGVDGFITDFPAVGRDVIDEFLAESERSTEDDQGQDENDDDQGQDEG